MKIHTAQSDDNLARLAGRLFNIKGPHSASLKRQAVAALERANPYLRPNAEIRAGTPVVVPDVEGLDRAAASTATLDLTEDTARQLRAALSQAGVILNSALAEKVKEEEEAGRQLKEHERELNAADQAVGKRLKKIKEAASTRLKELTEHKQLLKLSFAQLETDLEGLLKIASPG